MARQPLRTTRGTAAQVAAYAGPLGEIVTNADAKTIHLQDGVTPGGIAMLPVTGLASAATPARINGAVGRQLQQRLNAAPITPWDFGATGGPDDTLAVQKAIDAAILNYPVALDLTGSWNVTRVVAKGGNGLVIQGACNFVGVSSDPQPCIFEVSLSTFTVTDLLVLNGGYKTNYECGLWMYATSTVQCQYGMIDNVQPVFCKIGARLGRKDFPSAILSEITVKGIKTYACPVPVEIVGCQTVIHFVGAQINAEDNGGNAAWKALTKRTVRIIGGAAVFSGGEIMLTGSTTGAIVEFQPLLGVIGEGSKYGRVIFNGSHLEGGSPFIVMSNPDNIAVNATDGSKEYIALLGVTGYHSQDLYPAITTAADWDGDIDIKSCGVAVVGRTKPNIACGSIKTRVHTDDKGLGPTWPNAYAGVQGGSVKFSHRQIFYGNGLGGQSLAANPTKTTLLFQGADANEIRARYLPAYSSATGEFTVPAEGLKDVQVKAGIVANVAGHLLIMLNGTEYGISYAPAFGIQAFWEIPKLDPGDKVKVAFQPDGGAGASIAGNFQNWMSISARN